MFEKYFFVNEMRECLLFFRQNMI